ncbi:MAG: hypothetical protein IJA39_03515 [Clostridia bacterium]|nr:hypothetical protein [Clostridia bacterium]
MKKTLAIVLSVLMLVCMVPFASAATVHTFEASADFTRSDELVSGDTYVIPSGVTMTVPTGITLYVPTGAILRVEEGAKLNVLGNIIVLDGGQLFVEGFINGASNIEVNGTGTALAEIRFPSLAKLDLADKIEVSYGSSENGNIYEDLDGTVKFEKVSVGGSSAYAPLNQYIYIKASIIEPDLTYDKFDDSLMNVYFNGVGVPYTQGSHHTMLTTSGDITYSKWGKGDDSKFLNTFNIYLPTGEGYTVYGREGEQSADGETVKLKYGQSFSFKVEIDPEYDMSAYEVYVYNGYGWTNLDTTELLKDIAPAEPDEYGYYHIDQIKGEHTIYVVGVVKNETLLMVGDILDMIRNVFEMIAGFFAELMGFLGISFGDGTTTA